MSADVAPDRARAEVGRKQEFSSPWVKSYRYVRLAMVGLLAVLLLAVGYQTARQGWHVLGSLSGYYYTPAQAIFVGALIGLGACMIALRGTNEVEDVFLDLGGMFAVVVAIVPTSRGEDYETANELCKQAAGPAVTENASVGFDCPTIAELEAATKANVDNNMVALLLLGVVVLAFSLFTLLKKRNLNPIDRSGNQKLLKELKVWWGFVLAVLVFAAAAVAFLFRPDSFIENAHYVAAGGLIISILAVAAANAFRRKSKQGRSRGERARAVAGDRYSWFAYVMLGATGVTAAAWALDFVTLFWLEIVVAGFFMLFWLGQTADESRQLA